MTCFSCRGQTASKVTLIKYVNGEEQARTCLTGGTEEYTGTSTLLACPGGVSKGAFLYYECRSLPQQPPAEYFLFTVPVLNSVPKQTTQPLHQFSSSTDALRRLILRLHQCHSIK
jgi:hypothetical protein